MTHWGGVFLWFQPGGEVTFRGGGSTALYAAYTVDTVYTVDMVCKVDMVYTVDMV